MRIIPKPESGDIGGLGCPDPEPTQPSTRHKIPGIPTHLLKIGDVQNYGSWHMVSGRQKTSSSVLWDIQMEF